MLFDQISAWMYSECCIHDVWAVTYHFLYVTRAKPDWLVMGSGTGHTANLHVAQGDVAEEEVVVLLVDIPSSPFSLEKPYSQVPAKGTKRRRSVFSYLHVMPGL